MVGFSSPIDPNIIMKSIEKLIKTEKIIVQSNIIGLLHNKKEELDIEFLEQRKLNKFEIYNKI